MYLPWHGATLVRRTTRWRARIGVIVVADVPPPVREKPQHEHLALARRQELDRAHDHVTIDHRSGLIRDGAHGVVVFAERTFDRAAGQSAVAIVQQVDQHPMGVGVRRFTSLLPAPSGSHQCDLEQVLGMRSVAGEEVGAPQQPRRPSRDELVE
ncbi:hypothetical protein AYO39_00480 [Actinobacteria bacterium SCGC AG-212-D09]|nr:hypothetical protein AYO39_00480 [Actinobacteria bacterium SCGC AG-212-D09]